MNIQNTDFPGLFIIEPRVFKDDRGYFYESYNEEKFRKEGLFYNWVQDNQSSSMYGVIRGLHFQKNPKAQAKLVRVLDGEILDVAVDIRLGSPTFGKTYTIQLSSENKKQLLIPEGFAHGFSVLSRSALVLYKCNELYSPDNEGGINCKDPSFAIDWNIPDEKIIISDKDRQLLFFHDQTLNFRF